MTTTAYTVAAEAASYFETAKRDGSDDHYTRVKDDAPEWVRELVYAAHDGGRMLPDDWRYACISAAVDAIDEAGEDGDLDDVGAEFADGQVDTYTGERFAWLASNLQRQGYVDDAVSEGLASPELGIAERIGLGQYLEATEIFGAVRGWLELQAESRDDDEEGDDDGDE